jgi:poly(A)-specific ribonuclease
MTRYEKRLVHQTVRNEFPYLITKGCDNYVEVLHQRSELEAKDKKDQLDSLRYRCRYQRGFRWIVDALSGSREITQIPFHYLAHDEVTGESTMWNGGRMRARLNSIDWQIQRNRPALVGHNLFMDLVYFYRTFVGKLPRTIEAFQHEIHNLFPMIVDTKYLATWDAVDSNQFSSLDGLFDMVASQKAPCIGECSLGDDETRLNHGLMLKQSCLQSTTSTRLGSHTMKLAMTATPPRAL